MSAGNARIPTNEFSNFNCQVLDQLDQLDQLKIHLNMKIELVIQSTIMTPKMIQQLKSQLIQQLKRQLIQQLERQLCLTKEIKIQINHANHHTMMMMMMTMMSQITLRMDCHFDLTKETSP